MKKSIDRLRLAQFGNLELLAKQVVEGFITGMHKSPFHGFSVEFAEHRIYNTGESSRHVDWKLYGRTDKLFTKKYEEETNLRCQIVIDQSSSMYFPKNGDLTKFEFSVYAAASFIELLKRQRDAVGLTFIDESIEVHTENKTSLAHHKYLYSLLENRLKDYEPMNRKGSSLANCLHDIAELTHRRSLILIFTDLLSDPDHIDKLFQAIQHLKHNKHEVVLFNVLASSTELNFELEDRPYDLIDMETGEKMKIQPIEIREQYQALTQAYFKEITEKCTQYGIDFTQAKIEEGYGPVLLSYLLKRQKMR